jgi:hypothetical protein
MSASSGAPRPLEGWQGSTGISGSFQSELVATFAWNRWQGSTGISGNLRAEYARMRSRAAVQTVYETVQAMGSPVLAPTSLSPISAPLVCRVLGGARGVHVGSRLPAGRLERVQEEPQQAQPPRQPAQPGLVPHSAPVVAAFFKGEVERSRGERMAREGQERVVLSKRWAWGVVLPRRRRVPSVLSTCGHPA